MSQTSTPPRAVLSIRPLSTGPNYITTTSGSTSAGLQYILHQQQKRLQQRRIIAALNRQNQVQPRNRNQVVFQRFPNNNVVQVRRLVTQQPQQLQNIQNNRIVGGGGGGGNGNKEDQSSSDSNDGYNNDDIKGMPTLPQIKNGRVGGGETSRSVLRKPEDEKKLNTGEVRICMGKDVDISIVRSTEAKQNLGDDEDDDDEGKLVIDEAGDDNQALNQLVLDDEDDLNGGMEIEDEEAGGPDDKSALEMNGRSVDSEYLKHVIETQILNRHKTRITDWDGTKGHMCQSCHETFLSENGLEMHRNRRILHIFFFCRHCNRDLSFFNKCRLLQHLRNHRVTPTVSSLQNYIIIRLLPESEYLHFKYEDCTSSDDDDDNVTGGGGAGSGSGNSTTQASKRAKPSRFRKVARSSVSNDKDSDPSPPPSATRCAKSPPKELTAKPVSSKPLQPQSTPPSLVGSTTITSIPSSITVGAIKYTGRSSNSGVQNGSGNENQKPQQQQPVQRKEQATVIKSTASSVIVSSSSAVKASSTSDSTPKITTPAATANQQRSNPPSQPASITASSPTDSPDNIPRIRIKSLSQLIETNKPSNLSHNIPTPEVVRPAVPFSPQIVKVCSTQESPPNSLAPTQLPVVEQQQPQQQTTGSPRMESEWHCYKCEIDFESGQELFKHLQEAEQQGLTARSLHRCTTDDIVSWSQCQYVYHTKVFHERSVRFMCPGCGHQAPDYNSLLQHACNDCFYISQRARYMCAVSGQKCSFADKLLSVKTEPEIVDHLKKEHSRAILQCVNCTQGFATENWLLKHLADAHNMEFDESKSAAEREALISKATRPLTQCLICNILFPNGPTFLQHVYLNFHHHIIHGKIFECQGCLAVFETREQLTSHRNQNERCRNLDPFQMKICLSASTEMDSFPLSNPITVSESNSGTSTPQPQSFQMTPTPIKVVANPAAIITAAVTKPIQHPLQQPPLLQASPLQSQPQPKPAPPTIQIQQAPQLQIQPTPQLQLQPQSTSTIRQFIPQQQQQSPPTPTIPLPISILRPASTSGVPSAIVVISTANASGPTSPGNASQNVRSKAVPAATIYVQKPSTPPISSPISGSGSTNITSAVTANNGNAPKGQQTIVPASRKPAEKRPVNIAPKNQKQQFFDNLLQCQFCERLVIFSSLRKHEDQCCGLSTVAPGLCLCCRQNFGDRKTLARHGITHIKEGLTICLFCNNRRIRPTHPKSTSPTAHENLYALKKHLYSNHTSKLAKFPFQCPICDQACKDKRQTEYHIKDHQFNQSNNNSVDPSTDPVPLPTTPEEFRKLLRVRKKGEEPGQQTKIVDIYYCPVCKRREFTAELGLSRHLKFVHQRNPSSMDLSVFKKVSTSGKFHILPAEERASSPALETSQTEEKQEEKKVAVVSQSNRNLRARTTVQQSQQNQSASSSSDVKRKLVNMIPSNNGKASGAPNSFSSSAFTTRFTSGGIVLRKRLAPSSAGSSSAPPNKKSVPAILQRLQPPNTRQRSAQTSSSNIVKRPPSNFLQTRSSASAKVRKKDGTFACHKCPDFLCKTENEFYEHIKWKHVWPEAEIQKLQYGNKAGLEDPENYWCPECNLVFVAKPSLVRHLKFAHDYIANVEEYMQKIGYDGKKPLKPNQCEVCYLQCADEREHQQHMRTHGMAFLRLRQQRQQMDREMANKSNA